MLRLRSELKREDPLATIEALLTAFDGAAPSGPDLHYDAEFMALEQAVRGKPGEQYGRTVIPPQEPEWPGVMSAAERLLSRTKDLRIALIWTRAATRTTGFEGFCQGVALIEGMLARLWPTVHPQLDAADHDDPTMRLNTLAGLADPEGLLGDLRAAWLGLRNGADRLRIRDLELALGRSEPAASETVPSESAVRAALADRMADRPELAPQCAGADAGVVAIAATLDSKADAAAVPDLQPLRTLTRLVAEAAAQAAPRQDAAGEAAESTTAAAAARGGLKGRVDSREDALQALNRVCEWLARAEPTNPAPLVIRRAQKLMTMSFLDIVRDVAPGGVQQVISLIGADGDN